MSWIFVIAGSTGPEQSSQRCGLPSPDGPLKSAPLSSVSWVPPALRSNARSGGVVREDQPDALAALVGRRRRCCRSRRPRRPRPSTTRAPPALEMPVPYVALAAGGAGVGRRRRTGSSPPAGSVVLAGTATRSLGAPLAAAQPCSLQPEMSTGRGARVAQLDELARRARRAVHAELGDDHAGRRLGARGHGEHERREQRGGNRESSSWRGTLAARRGHVCEEVRAPGLRR